MLARAADSLYWIGRYLERAEHGARLLEVHLDLMLYQAGDDVTAAWRRLCETIEASECAAGEIDPSAIARYVSEDFDNPNSMVNCIGAARENARHIREVISSEMWAQLNSLYLRSRRLRIDAAWHEPHAGVFRSFQDGLNLFKGISDSSFSHGEGWYFLRLGRYLERATATCRLLAAHLDELPADFDDTRPRTADLGWLGLLRSCGALEAFTRTHTADPRPRLIASFLLLNPEFPHSLRFAVDQACSAVSELSRITGTGAVRAGQLAQSSGRLRAQLEYASAEEILAGGAVDYLSSIHVRLEALHDLIQATYTSYALTESPVFV